MTTETLAKISATCKKQIRYTNPSKNPDFTLGAIVIECTFRYDVKQKALELSQDSGLSYTNS